MPAATKPATSTMPLANGAGGGASTILSPNHPINLRKQAQPKLDSGFSVKSYIGAANALLEKAQAADVQGQLEVAFVNYLKAAGVASFISKHDEWPRIQKSRGSTYQAYNEFMQQVPSFIDRTKRIEEQLRIREEENAVQQREAQSRDGEAKNNAMERARSSGAFGVRSPLAATDLSPGSPAYTDGLNAVEREQGAGTDAQTASAEVLGSRHGAHTRMSASLAERLQALRGAGVDGATIDKRPHIRSSSLSDPIGGAIPRSGDLATHLEALAERDDRDSGDEPEPPVARDGMASPKLPHDDSFSMHAVSSALRHYQSSGRGDNGQPDGPETSHVPTASEFESSYPTLDAFERENGLDASPAGPASAAADADGDGTNQHGAFPTAPVHPVGKVKRPLPEPPSATSSDVAREFAIARSVPEPFKVPDDGESQQGQAPISSRRPPDGSPHVARMSLQGERRGSVTSLPPSLRPGSISAPGQAAAANGTCGSTPSGAAASLIVGQKPNAPLTNHITVKELFHFLYPGYEEFTDADGNKKIGKRRGMDVLLLDVRCRQEWEMCRIKGGRSACIEPIILRENMSSADIEDKLLLSPEEEQVSFAARNEVDLVVLYDNNLRSLKAQPGAPTLQANADVAARKRMDIVIKAIYENEFRKILKHQPVLLVGGLESWHKALGEKGVVRKRLQSSEGGGGATNVPSDAAPRRTSISFEPGTRFPTADSPSSRAATTEQLAQQELKRSRRQQQILPDSIAGASQTTSPVLRMPGLHPGSVYPGSAASAGTSFGAIPGYAAGGAPGTPGSFAAPSIPPRTYQSPGGPAGLSPGAPSYPPAAPARSDDYFDGAPPDRQRAAPRTNSSSFDYPQLRQNGQPYTLSTPQPPPAAAPYPGPTASGRSSRTASISATQLPLLPAGPAALQDPSKKQVAPPGYAGYHPAPSRMYSGSTSSKSRSAEDIRIGLTGLKNLGNSCYMNSTLQCLSATIPLARFLLDGSYKRAINKVNPLGTQGALAEAFAQLVRVMWSEQYTFVSPVTFREAIARFAPSFRGYDQHDSQEFLAFLLDGLHEDLNYVVHKPPPVEMTPERERELETLPQQIASVKEWGIYRMRNDSLIVDWFQGQFRNKMTCLTCGKTSTTYNAFMYLSLPIPHGRGMHRVTLQQCLDAFVKEEILDKADAWNCPQCKKPRKASKRLSISRLPQVLLIHLKRFSFKGPFTDKIDTTVTFPTSGLDLTNYMPPPLPPGAIGKGMPVSQSQQPPYLYDLYGVTHHFGSLNTGHYTATIRNHGEWWYCDDSRISKGDDRQIQTNSPYVLWFRRRPNH
ncbi:ubiquitin-specific protease doa4 [Thecaphora frezii]